MTFNQMIIFCILELLSFIVGAKVGLSCAKGKEMKFNPVSAVKNSIDNLKKEKLEIKRQQKLDTIMQNIDNYNGTGLGQRTIPKD